jgi:hypothetical protein
MPELARSAAQRIGRELDAAPDRIDIRDWFYRPGLAPLPDQVVNINAVPRVLDQGHEGACTGFALAAVVNYQLAKRSLKHSASPRMLYEMARRYDEWPGEGYVGSSARGAMIGWARHGVCSDDQWPVHLAGSDHFTPERANLALRTPGGAYYRVMHRSVRDMHAALAELGILFCTLMVHSGWANPAGKAETIHFFENGNRFKRSLPLIQRDGRADSGHAVAIVGYTERGFIVQNSWGEQWGDGGFALLPYEDFLIHSTDVWAAQLGVPVLSNLWVEQETTDSVAGLQRAAESIPLETIRPFVVDIGNNGKLSDTGQYWTTKSDVELLFNDVIPKATASWKKRRILLYLHGGLNSEVDAAKRIVAYRNVMLANEIYPLHIMWESGAFESIRNLLDDVFVEPDPSAGALADWLHKTREHLIEAKDRTFELTVARAGTAIWNEMKENAQLASNRKDRDGGMQIVAAAARNSLSGLSAAARQSWELHVVGHSAGSILAAYALPHLVSLGVTFKTLQFLAPAITIAEFRKTMLPAIRNGTAPHPSLFILSDQGELDDNVGPGGAYGKSLLYLVSNAFEGRRDVPLLGMERFLRGEVANSDADPEIEKLFRQSVDGRPALVIAGAELSAPERRAGRRHGPAATRAAANGRRASDRLDLSSLSRSDSHGGFDNDDATMNSVLYRILGRAPARAFDARDLQF